MSDDWCQRVIRPIHQNKCDLNDPNNYRLISLLSGLKNFSEAVQIGNEPINL